MDAWLLDPRGRAPPARTSLDRSFAARWSSIYQGKVDVWPRAFMPPWIRSRRRYNDLLVNIRGTRILSAFKLNKIRDSGFQISAARNMSASSKGLYLAVERIFPLPQKFADHRQCLGQCCCVACVGVPRNARPPAKQGVFLGPDRRAPRLVDQIALPGASGKPQSGEPKTKTQRPPR